MGKRFGYARVSTSGQDTDRQEVDLLAAGVRRDDLYVDRGVTGRKMNRPALDQVLSLLQAGDTLAVVTLDRLGRVGPEMSQLVMDLNARDVRVEILNLGGEHVDTNSTMGKLLVQVMAAIAQAESEIRQERIKDSIAKRRVAGGNLGGRPQAVSDDVIRGIQRDVENGMSVAAACRKGNRNITRPTYYRRLAQLD